MPQPSYSAGGWPTGGTLGSLNDPKFNRIEKVHKASPGDGGLCPRCGEDMKAKVYTSYISGVGFKECSGRYWHMKNEHRIMEDYHPRGRRI